MLFFLQTSLGETLALLKKHEDFEKTAATQEERFLALKKLTTVSFRPNRFRAIETGSARILHLLS